MATNRRRQSQIARNCLDLQGDAIAACAPSLEPTMVVTPCLRRLVTFPRFTQVRETAGPISGVLFAEVPLLPENPPLWPISTRIVAIIDPDER